MTTTVLSQIYCRYIPLVSCPKVPFHLASCDISPLFLTLALKPKKQNKKQTNHVIYVECDIHKLMVIPIVICTILYDIIMHFYYMKVSLYLYYDRYAKGMRRGEKRTEILIFNGNERKKNRLYQVVISCSSSSILLTKLS